MLQVVLKKFFKKIKVEGFSVWVTQEFFSLNFSRQTSENLQQSSTLIKYTITYLLNIQKAERSEIISTDGRKQIKQIHSHLSISETKESGGVQVYQKQHYKKLNVLEIKHQRARRKSTLRSL